MRGHSPRGGRRALGARLVPALLGVLLGASLPAAAEAAQLAPHPARAPLRLCLDPDNLPFSSARPGTPGLYAEIGEAVAAALGRAAEPVWSLSNWGKHNVRETLLAGRCDIAVGLPDDSDFMGPRVIFTRPILDVGYALLVPKGQPVVHLADLAGQRVAAQFASPPQSLLAMRDDITLVTVLSPEEAAAKLRAHTVDAAFIWGPSAGYLNHAVLGDAYRVVPVAGAGMEFRAAIGVARTQKALRDAVDAALPAVLPRIPAMAARYNLPTAAPLQLSAAGAEPSYVLAADDSAKLADEGKELFNGTCAHCHGPDAVVSARKINLRLLKHRYGDKMDEVFHITVTHGRPDKGMPNWSGIFTEDDFTKILAFLKTVQTPD